MGFALDHARPSDKEQFARSYMHVSDFEFGRIYHSERSEDSLSNRQFREERKCQPHRRLPKSSAHNDGNSLQPQEHGNRESSLRFGMTERCLPARPKEQLLFHFRLLISMP